MPLGGKRQGAGRPRGSRNRKTVETTKAVESSGLTPLDFMLQLMRDEGQPLPMRQDAAKNAAPYVHARLAAVELSGKGGGPVELVLRGSDIDG